METEICCAYNATRKCQLSSHVAIADSLRQPLKVLNILIKGFAQDSQSGLWLTPLSMAPDNMRLFPFDLVYLDSDLKVIEAVELLPEIPFPRFSREVASALILRLRTLSATETRVGDRLIICAEVDLKLRIEELSSSAAQPVAPSPVASVVNLPVTFPPSPIPTTTTHPGPPVFMPIRVAPVAQGSGFTVALNTSWQITNSTAAVLSENIDAALKTSQSEAVPDTADVATPAEPPTARETVTAPIVSLEDITQESRAAELPASPAVDLKTEDAAQAEQRTPNVTHPANRASVTNIRQAKAKGINPGIEPETSSQKPKPKDKGSLKSRVKRWLNVADPLAERRKSTRLLLQGLVARDAKSSIPKIHDVADVSPTGLYVRTEESWSPGDVVSLTLQKKGSTNESREGVSVQASAVRIGKDGVGLSFVLPEGVEFHPWHRLQTKDAHETDAEYFLRELRLAKAMGFLQRICQPASQEIRQQLHVRHSNKRVASAVEIALKAEELLEERGGSGRLLAHPDLVVRIIEDGSWAEDKWIQGLWAGLLATSCSTDGQDKSNLVFVELLDKLTPIHLRILSAACRRSAEVIAKGESTATLTLYFTADELIEASGSTSFVRIQQTIGHLSNFGLLAENKRPSYISATEKTKTKTTPTALGLEMHARCSGRR